MLKGAPDTEPLLSSPVTGAQLLEIGEIHESPDPFVRQVSALLSSESALRDELISQSGGLINDLDSPHLVDLRELQLSLEISRSCQYHYVTTSAHHDQSRESLYAAMVAKRADQAGHHPLVVPIDAFYQYQSQDWDQGPPSIVEKMRCFGAENPVPRDGRPNLMILTNVSGSDLFDEAILRKVPMESVAFNTPGFRDFVFYRLQSQIKKYGGPVKFLQEMIRLNPDSKDQIKLVICTAIIASNQRGWQKLPHAKVPLVIIAPQPFNDALNRINNGQGAWSMEYMYRASTHVDEPMFDTATDGRPFVRGPKQRISYERNAEAYLSGASKEEFEEAFAKLIEILG